MLASVTSFLAVVSFVGIIGNLIVISVYTRKKDRQTSTFFILILAFSDLIVCSVLIPMTIYFENVAFHTVNIYLCKTYFFITTSTVPASCLLMTAIAFDRYFCICMVNRNIMTPFRAKIIVGILLMLAGFLSVIPTLNAIINERHDDEHGHSSNTTTVVYPEVTSVNMDHFTHGFELNTTTVYMDPASAYSVCEIDLNGALGSWVMPFKRFYDLIYFCSVMVISILYILIYKKIYTRRKAKRLRRRRLLTNSMLYNGAGGGDFERNSKKHRLLVVSESHSRKGSSKKQKTKTKLVSPSTQLIVSNSTRMGVDNTEMETIKFQDEEVGKTRFNLSQETAGDSLKTLNNHKSSMIKSGQLVKESVQNNDDTSLNTNNGCCLISMSVCFGQFIIDNKKAANLKKKIASTSSGSRSINTEFIEKCSVTKLNSRVMYADQTAQAGSNEPAKKPSCLKQEDPNAIANTTEARASKSSELLPERTATSSILKDTSAKRLEQERNKSDTIPRTLQKANSNGSTSRLTICAPGDMIKMTNSSESIINDNKSMDDQRYTAKSVTSLSQSHAGRRISISKKTPLIISIKDIRTAFMLFVVSLLFIVFYLPSILATKFILANDNLFLVYLYFTNSAINPMIYCFMNRSFRSDLLKIFIKRNRKFLPPTSRFSTLIAISLNPNVMDLKNSK